MVFGKEEEETSKRSAGVSRSTSSGAPGTGKLQKHLPDYLLPALKSGRQWKTFARCMVATLATLVLLLAQKCELLQMMQSRVTDLDSVERTGISRVLRVNW